MAEQPQAASARFDAAGLLARATVIATFGLIIAGGLVTSRDAGLAVPDWPLSFGTVNPPGWLSIVNVRTEHGHRLVAACVALLTCATAWVVRRREQRTVVRRFAALAAGLVLFQALLGGLRVLHLSVDLAMLHALTAQLFLAVVVVLATMTSPRWERDRPLLRITAADKWRDGLLLGAVLGQLLLGIFIRHLGVDARPLLPNGVFQAHVTLGIIILALALRARRIAFAAGPIARRRASTVFWLVVAQVVLGFASFAVTETMSYDRQATIAESWLPTLHLLVGAAILAACVRSLAYTILGPAGSRIAVEPVASLAEASH